MSEELEQPATDAAELPPVNPADAPTQPGCYLMKDAAGHILYVGKAINLRQRIRSYVNETDTRANVRFLMRRVASIDYLVVATEKEALLLENSLIKQHKPRYNVRLKDDKTYLSLRLNPHEDFPRITIVRRFQRDGARYFGPYHDATAARKTLRQIQRLFPMRLCSDNVLHNRTRPCLYYQMGQCLAPCVGLVNREAYHELVEQVMLVLEGRSTELEKRLMEKIRALADALRFEEAAALRDRLRDLGLTLERQRTVVAGSVEDRDVFGVHTEGRFTELQVLFYRGGKLLGGRSWSFEAHDMPLAEVLGSFLLQYYDTAPVVPREVIVPVEVDEAEVLAALLSEKRNGRVEILFPQRGDKLKLVELATRNAERSAAEKKMADKAAKDALELIQKTLKLPRLPERIECFDVSTTQGDKTVASMAVFEGGLPAKQRYRKYAMRSVEGQDDFASLREALMRRYTRAVEENDLPDLVLIDGGRGQLGVADAVLKDLGLDDLPHASIAKSRPEEGGSQSPERFFLPGRVNPIIPPQHGPVVRTLARLRDEAHRFAVTYHRQKRSKAVLSSALLGVPGLGPKRAKALLTALGSVARIRGASPAEIAAVPGFSEKLARVVVQHLQQSGSAEALTGTPERESGGTPS